MAQIGSIIDGKYEILKLVGQGGMSKVYLAMDKRLNKQWAVKEIEKCAKDKNNEVIIQSSIAEVNMMKRLDHSALPRIVDIIDHKDVIYVVMDYIEGVALSSVLEEYGAQPQDLVIEWAKQLCEVLDYLHTRKPAIIYRDMKPANVMLKPDGSLKLIDFGIAREYKETNLSDTVSLGTKGYAAPEQFGGKGQTNACTDVYCLGVTLYHLVTGQNPCEPPYELYPIRTWNPTLSTGLEKIILKCTQLNPEDRYQTCAELLYDLHHYEEIDDAYRAKQWRKLKVFLSSCGLTIFFLCMGIVAQFMEIKTNNQNYESYIIRAQNTSNEEEKIDYYLQAISLKPDEKLAYEGILALFKSDAVFTVEEEEQFKKGIYPHLYKVRESEMYPDLAFEIGKLYWYYYDYGRENGEDNQLTRMKHSISWFHDVVQFGSKDAAYYKMALVYRDIAIFNRDITLLIEEASDKGSYQVYWENIQHLLTLLEEHPDESEIVKLEFYKLASYSIETYARKLKADGIDEYIMRDVYQRIMRNTNDIQASTDKTEQLKTYILSRSTQVLASIENAFRMKGRGN